MKTTLAVCGLIALLLAPGVAQAARDRQPIGRAFPAHGEGIQNDQTIGVNNIRMFVTNTGSFAWDKEGAGQPAGFEFPRGSGKTAVYAAGLWLGAKVNGGIRLAISEYSDEYMPGAIVGGAPDDPNKAEYKVYKLDRVYADHAVRDAALADYNAGAVPHGAPAVSVQSDGSLNTLGDEMMWAVYNDLDSTQHNNRADNLGKALGIEVQQTTFAFSAQGALGNTVFIKYRFINKGPWTLENMYASQWADPDLGNASDDLVGCDVAKSIGYVYNANNNDGVYGSNPPCVGFDFFKGPTVSGSPLGLSSFNKYINGTDPNTAVKSYNYMQGFDADGNPVVDPTTGSDTKYVVNGDPVTGSGWLDANPADRRMMLSSGPFTMMPGDTQEVVVGIVVGQSTNRISSVALMKFLDQTAQSTFNLNFNVPHPPDPPTVKATPQHGAIRLTWDAHSENYQADGYGFEGYAVYQGASRSGPWTRIATFDKPDGITTVLDDVFDGVAGVPLPQVAAQGTDKGIEYSYLVGSDVIGGGPLNDATAYYYTVRAYAVSTAITPHVLESADSVKTVVPQTPPAGVDLASAILGVPTYGRYDAFLGATTDSVKAVLKDPNQVVSGAYKVGYKPGADGVPLWYLVRTTAAGTDTVINNNANYSGDEHYPIVDGVQVKVIGAPYKQVLSMEYVPVGTNAPGLVPDPGNGLSYWDPLGTGGGADYGWNYFGSSLDPADVSLFHNVEIRFTGGAAGQKAYRYLRCNCSPRTYLYQDYVDVPFTVWDTDANRQLNVGFLENWVNANGVWDPDTVDDFGGAPYDDRQPLFVLGSTYNATAQAFYTTTNPDMLNDAGNIDVQYIIWPKATHTPLTILNGDKFKVTLASRSPNDYFTFSTTAPNRSSTALARAELQRVLAVPNPYLAHSAYEEDQFNRVVKFTHLPAHCTIRLFSLGGDLVRTIEKNDATSQAVWDLTTDRSLPVASGIYVFHVDAPGIGSKVGKVAVFIEKERLNNY